MLTLSAQKKKMLWPVMLWLVMLWLVMLWPVNKTGSHADHSNLFTSTALNNSLEGSGNSGYAG